MWTRLTLTNAVRKTYEAAWLSLLNASRRRVLIDSIFEPKRFRSSIAVLADIHRLFGDEEENIERFVVALNAFLVELQFQRAALRAVVKNPKHTFERNDSILLILKFPRMSFNPPRPGLETRVNFCHQRISALVETLLRSPKYDMSVNLKEFYSSLLREQIAYYKKKIYLRETSKEAHFLVRTISSQALGQSKAGALRRLNQLPALNELLLKVDSL
jgi:hypothetical protein